MEEADRMILSTEVLQSGIFLCCASLPSAPMPPTHSLPPRSVEAYVETSTRCEPVFSLLRRSLLYVPTKRESFPFVSCLTRHSTFRALQSLS